MVRGGLGTFPQQVLRPQPFSSDAKPPRIPQFLKRHMRSLNTS